MSLLLASTLSVFGPLLVHATNVDEFNFSFGHFLAYGLPVCALCFLAVASLLLLFSWSQRLHCLSTSIALAVTILIWLQGNLFLWSYGQLDGSELRWEENLSRGIFEILVWGLALFLAVVKRQFFYRNIVSVFALITILQLSTVSYLILQTDPASHQRYGIEEQNKFVFSDERNVILLVLDTFQSDVFSTIVEEDPGYKDLLDGFVFFRNNLGVFPTTYASVPAILTARHYDNSVPVQTFIQSAFLSDSSVPYLLKENGFIVELFPLSEQFVLLDDRVLANIGKRTSVSHHELARLYDVSLFRHSPHFAKMYIHDEHNWLLQRAFPKQPDPLSARSGSPSQEAQSARPVGAKTGDSTARVDRFPDIQFIRRMVADSTVEDRAPTFKYFHLRGAHNPFWLNEDLQYEDMGSDYRQGDGFKRQSKAALRITGMFLERLKELEIYDRSLIMVIGDHGYAFDRVSSSMPLFLLKDFGASGEMKVSDAPVSLSDIPATVFEATEIPNGAPGVSALSSSAGKTRERRYYYYTWSAEYHDLSKKYLPPMTEYIVDGPARSEAAWRETFKVYKAQRVDYRPPLLRLRETVRFGARGNAAIFQGEGWSPSRGRFTGTHARRASLRFAVEPRRSDVSFSFRILPRRRAGHDDPKQVTVFVDHREVETVTIDTPGIQRLTVPVAASAFSDGYLTIAFAVAEDRTQSGLAATKASRRLDLAFLDMVAEEITRPPRSDQ